MKDVRRIDKGLILLTAALTVLLATATSGQAATTRWTVDGYRILLNGQPFFAKGMGYYPLPAGNSSSKTPFGDYFYNFPGGDPVWRIYLDRDLPLMRAAGVNLIRLYSMWAWARADFTVSPLNVDKTRTLSHQGFMDMAYNNGVHPMYVLVNVFIEAGRSSDPAYQAQVEDVYRQLATELKDQPAVMGFMVGNELNSEGTRVRDPSRPLDQNYNVNANRPWPPDTLVPRQAYAVIKDLFTKPDPEVRVNTRPAAGADARGQGARRSPQASEATTSDEIQVGISLLSNQYEGLMADWYVGVVVYPHRDAETGTVYYLLLVDGTWQWRAATRPFDLPSAPTHVGPVQQVTHIEIHSGPVAPGYYVLFLALAINRDGNGVEVYADTAELNVVGE